MVPQSPSNILTHLPRSKPRTARSKRALDKKAPLAHENAKTTLFLRGSTCSEIVQQALTDLYALKRPLAIKFHKKNANIHPFEDASSLEFFAQKNDAALLVFGSHSKKRPHCLTLVRCFDGRVLELLELYLQPEAFRTLAQFRGRSCGVGLKPLILFAGARFEGPGEDKYTLAKSLLLDLFRGQEVQSVDVEGLQYLVSVSVGEEVEEGLEPLVHLRVYLIRTKRSGQRLPRVEVEEMGPRMDFRLGRMREAEPGMLKEAMKKVKGTEVSLAGFINGLVWSC